MHVLPLPARPPAQSARRLRAPIAGSPARPSTAPTVLFLTTHLWCILGGSIRKRIGSHGMKGMPDRIYRFYDMPPMKPLLCQSKGEQGGVASPCRNDANETVFEMCARRSGDQPLTAYTAHASSLRLATAAKMQERL